MTLPQRLGGVCLRLVRVLALGLGEQLGVDPDRALLGRRVREVLGEDRALAVDTCFVFASCVLACRGSAVLVAVSPRRLFGTSASVTTSSSVSPLIFR